MFCDPSDYMETRFYSLSCSLSNVYWSIDCPSRDSNKFETTNGSVSLAVSISPGDQPHFFRVKTWRAGYTQVLLCVQDFVTKNGDYLMFDNSHQLKTRSETVSTLTLHPHSSFDISKIKGRHILHWLLENHIKLNQSSKLTLTLATNLF